MWECDLFDGGCKSFPPPLVRGGVFLVGLETKYRDIADGNFITDKTGRPSTYVGY